jgi:predicted site-specific integrase-resolvase
MEKYGILWTNFPYYFSQMKRLRDYAKENGIGYRAAWNRFKNGKILGAFKDESGLVLIPEKIDVKPEYTVIYVRVSSSENKSNLEGQAKRLSDYCVVNNH